MEEDFPYEIIDLETLVPKLDKSDIVFKIGITVMVPNSYSHALSIFTCRILSNYKGADLVPVNSMSANPLYRDSYYVTNLLAIPNTELLIVVIEDFGMQIVNTT